MKSKIASQDISRTRSPRSNDSAWDPAAHAHGKAPDQPLSAGVINVLPNDIIAANPARSAELGDYMNDPAEA